MKIGYAQQSVQLATHATYGAIHHRTITLNRTAQQAAAAARAGGAWVLRRSRGELPFPSSSFVMPSLRDGSGRKKRVSEGT